MLADDTNRFEFTQVRKVLQTLADLAAVKSGTLNFWEPSQADKPPIVVARVVQQDVRDVAIFDVELGDVACQT